MISACIRFVIIGIAVAIIITGIVVTVVMTTKSAESSEIECSNFVGPFLKIEVKEDLVVIEWSRPTTSNCEITYYLKVNMNGETNYEGYNTTDTSLIISKRPKFCTLIQVSITALGKETGIGASSSSKLVLPKKADVDGAIIKIESFSSHLEHLTWTIQPDFKGCELSYEITVNEFTNIQDILPNSHWFISRELYKSCKDNIVKLKPIVEGIVGVDIDVSDEIEVQPTQKKIDSSININAIYDSNNMILKWTDNSEMEYKGCEVKYKLTINEKEFINFETPNTHIFTSQQLSKPCKANVITLTPIVIGIYGEVNGSDKYVSELIEVPLQNIPEIDGTFELFGSKTARVSWAIQEGFETCELTYDLKLIENFDVLDSISDYKEEILFWEPDVGGRDECGVLKVTITPKYKSDIGDIKELDCFIN
ncbi:uncharacterized protein [Onthophagus taurus]|uniref:uncharacterized protein isoform X1 n=1 Tax=Onthophagus taurus TaxID=166361 RepID=UPI0039BEB877